MTANDVFDFPFKKLMMYFAPSSVRLFPLRHFSPQTGHDKSSTRTGQDVSRNARRIARTPLCVMLFSSTLIPTHDIYRQCTAPEAPEGPSDE